MQHYPALLGVLEEMLQGSSDTYLLGSREFQSACFSLSVGLFLCECWSVPVCVLVCLCV